MAVNNLITLVSIALGNNDPSVCQNGIPTGAQVNVALLVQAVNNALSGCPAPTFAPLEFHNAPITGSYVPVPVALDGTLKFSGNGQLLTGQLVATYGVGGSAMVVGGSDGSLVIHIGADQFDLMPNDSHSVSVNGVRVSAGDAITAYVSDVNSGQSPEQWSVTGQATLALMALSSTPAWAVVVSGVSPNRTSGTADSAGMGNILAPAVSLPPVLCKPAAYTAATALTILAGGGCALLLAGCTATAPLPVPGITALSWGVASGLCAGGLYAGPSAAFEATLAAWSEAAPTPTNTATSTATKTPTPTVTNTRTASVTGTATVTRTATVTGTATVTETPSVTPTIGECDSALMQGCALTLSVNPSNGYDGTPYTVSGAIDPEHAPQIHKVTGTCQGDFLLDLGPGGLFQSQSFPSSGVGVVKISVFAYDANNSVVCCNIINFTGKGPAIDGTPCDNQTPCTGGACDIATHQCCGDISLCSQGTPCSSDLQCDIDLFCPNGTCQPAPGG